MSGGDTSRRRALRLLLGGALAARVRPVRASPAALPDSADVLVAELADVPPGAVKTASFHGMPILVLNVGGKIEVLSAVCTHESCTVTWDAEKQLLVCPCHSGVFDRLGRVVGGPPPAPLIQLPVKVEGGKIFVVD